MGTRPRTPEHFPSMKVRGARRRNGQRVSQLRQVGGTAADWSSFARALGDFAKRIVAALGAIGELRVAEWRRSDYALTNPTTERIT
jgi:hypothetical protein